MNYNRIESRFKELEPELARTATFAYRRVSMGTAVLVTCTRYGRKWRAFVVIVDAADIPAPVVADHLAYKLQRALGGLYHVQGVSGRQRNQAGRTNVPMAK